MKAARTVLAASALALALALTSTALAAAELRFTVWTGNEAHLACSTASPRASRRPIRT